MIRLILITNHPQIARFAVDSGVDRIMVDLEALGKKERQGHLDTLMSTHHLSDITPVRRVIGERELIVRLNPLHSGSPAEVSDAVDQGADTLMLPMYRTESEVREFRDMVPSAVHVLPLLETADAVGCLEETAVIPDIREIYIGLNDLHLSMGLDFMFEPLGMGLVDEMAGRLNRHGLSFGFGGIAKVGEGLLPGELVLGEHLRLGSSSVILSRTFHQRSVTLEELRQRVDLPREIQRLREVERQLGQRSTSQVEVDRERTKVCIREIAEKLRSRFGSTHLRH